MEHSGLTTELAATVITVVGFVGTIFNVWLTARIRADISELKLWVIGNFVSKTDLPLHLAPLREAMQLRDSEMRLKPN